MEGDKCMGKCKDIKYHIGFKMKIFGCKLNFEIKEKKLLELLSKGNCKVVELKFTENEDGSILTGSILAKGNMQKHIEEGCIKGYSFILYELKSSIIKTLVMMDDIEDLKIDDDIEIFIKNEKELKMANIKVIPYSDKFAILRPKLPSISKVDFLKGIKNLYIAERDFEKAMLWQYISYHVTDIKKGKGRYDIISQFRLLWTAFNSIYNVLYPDSRDRKAVEKYSQKVYVIKYFKENLNNLWFYEILRDFANSNLTLKGRDGEVSQKLKKYLEIEDYKSISKYSLLCLYSIRNGIMHGSADKEMSLCRAGFKILNSLIKHCINQELLVKAKENKCNYE